MSIWQAILLGIVQGLTEFLPVSSTAHLLITPELCGFRDPGAAFTAIIQLGTLAAVIWYFAGDIKRLLVGWTRGILTGRPWDSTESRQGWLILLATGPIIVCGLLCKKWIEGPLRELHIVAVQLIVGSLLMLLAEWVARRRQQGGKSAEELSLREVFGTGCFQALALMPGMSRSGSTISGGLLLGMSRETATRFSFLLSLPAIAAAGLYKLWDDVVKPELSGGGGLIQGRQDLINLLTATVVAGIVGYAAIGFLLRYLRTRSMNLFVLYRLLLAAFLLWSWQQGWYQTAQ